MRHAVWLACLALGCSAGTMSPDEFQKEFGISASSTGQVEVNTYWSSGLNQCLASFRAAVGTSDIEATNLDLHPTYAYVSAREPGNPDNVDRYECQHGKVGPSTPVKLGSRQKTLAEDSFRLSDIDFDGLPARIESAPSLLGIADGKVTMVGINKAGPADHRYVSVTISVVGTRKDGSIEYDGKGQRIVGPPPTSATTVTPKLTPWTERDAPELVGLTTVDPMAKPLAWGRKVASAWKGDATFYWLKASDPTPNGTVDLTKNYMELWFMSPSCFAANAADNCTLNLLVDKKVASGHASFAEFPLVGPHDPLSPVACTLQKAIAAAVKRDPSFKCTSADLHMRMVATWTLQPGALQVDATTCAVGL